MQKAVRRARLLSPVVAVLLGAAAPFVLAGCGGVSVPEDVLTLEGIAQAAETSADATSGRFGFVMEMALPDGQPLSFSATGSFDTSSARTAVTLDMSAFGSLLAGLAGSFGGDAPDFSDPGLWKIDVVQDGLVMYMRFPLATKELPRGKTWVRIDLREASRLQGFDLEQLQQFTSNDPRDALRYLEAVAGELERIGKETLHGVETTRYRTTIDLLRLRKLAPPAQREAFGSTVEQLVAQSGLRTIPVEVWVDANGFVRRMEMTLSATPPGTSEAFQASMRFELYDYGKDVEIELPPTAQVVDSSAIKQ